MHPTRVAPNYLPFADGTYRLSMGLTSLPERQWLEFGPGFGAYLAAKRTLLASRHGEVFAALPVADSAAAELLALLAQHLCAHHPDLFRRDDEHLINSATGERWLLEDPVLHPLDLAGRLVAEDLCIVQPMSGQYVLTGASLCFPNRWHLAEKLGQPLDAIHVPVPGYAEQLASKVNQFIAGLKPARLFGRANWGIASDPMLFQPVAPPLAAAVTAENAGERLWLRIERQTLRRLPQSGAVIFTIHTEITRLDHALAGPRRAADLAAAIRDMTPATQRYKDIAPFAEALLPWLDARAAAA
jgi:Haem-dependent oxidative N-demethylase, alpha subunit-like